MPASRFNEWTNWQHRGFTLVELLVVMTVIAILAGLLLPALAQAKEKARQTACRNNVRQQTLAVLLYADEHGDFLPPTAFYDGQGDEIDWPALLDPYLNFTSGIHLCPTDRKSRLNSYGLNELVFVDLTDPDPPPQNRRAALLTPSATIMQGDLGTEDDFITPRADARKLTAPGSDLNDDQDARPAARHAGRCDLGFMDGHNEELLLRQFYLGQNPTNKWFLP